jgi:anti-sigma factor RsiW
MPHITERKLESYAMGTIPGRSANRLEEYLLFCPGCLNRLQSWDVYVASMKAAARTSTREHAAPLKTR